MVQCIRNHKPYKLIDAQVISVSLACELASAFIADFEMVVLNVAGPRLSQWADGHSFTRATMSQVINSLICQLSIL